VYEINTHIENRVDQLMPTEKAEDARPKVEAQLKKALAETPGLTCQKMQVYRQEKRLIVALHCEVDGDKTVSEAHRLSSRLEETLRLRMPMIERVQIHVEPS
jgi:divalent metal cation (Fe/Co/Zn/Cd) transporter